MWVVTYNSIYTNIFRSEASGNCLYSSTSLALLGDNSLVSDLRILTSLELFFNAEFYCNHPCFLSLFDNCNGVFSSFNSIFNMCLSISTVDKDLSSVDAVKAEAISNCCDKQWSSFLCILGLATVINRKIVSFYPELGQVKYKLLFNQQIDPRGTTGSCRSHDIIYLLFCREGKIEPGVTFNSNHFVPLVLSSTVKRKLTVVSSKPSKKISSYVNVDLTAEENKVQSKISFLPKLPVKKEVNLCSSNINFPKMGSTKTSNTQSLGSTKTSNTQSLPVSTYDIATYRDKVRTCNDSEILKLINEVFVPDSAYPFPKKAGRSFRLDWIKSFSWLAYSPSLDGGFCLPCVLFGDKFPSKLGKIKKLFSDPVVYWPDAKATFSRHVGVVSGLHRETTNMLTIFLSNMSGKTQPINVLLNINAQKLIAENRNKLVPIVDTIRLCGRLCIPLRGHRDDSQYHPQVGSYSQGGVGNFVELLNYRVRGGDVVLAEHLKKCSKNATYISKTTQNELISCCGELITSKILSAVKKAKFFSIIADEAADSSNKEQMSLVLRFVDNNLVIREDFVRFIDCKEGLAGVNLASTLLKTISNLGLDIMNCRGQGYDGAGSVAGHINGLSAHILRLNNKALYTHCHSHRINLSISKSCAVGYFILF